MHNDEIKAPSSESCLSMDLDNTLVNSDANFSPDMINLLKLTNSYNIPCFILTSRCIASQMHAIIDSLKAKRSLTKIIAYIEKTSFQRLNASLQSNGINFAIPFAQLMIPA